MDTIRDPHSEHHFLSALLLYFALGNLKLCNLVREPRQELRFVRVVEEKVNSTQFVLKSYGFGSWEGGSYLEQLFRDHFVIPFEFIRNTNWDRIELFNLKLRHLEVWRKHRRLQRAPPRNAVLRVQGPAQIFLVHYQLDAFLDTRYSRCLSNKLHVINVVNRQTYSNRNN